MWKVIVFSPFYAPLGPLDLIIVRNFPKKSGNVAMPRSGKNSDSAWSLLLTGLSWLLFALP